MYLLNFLFHHLYLLLRKWPVKTCPVVYFTLSFFFFLQVFKGHEFYPIGSLSDDVPVLSCSSLSKKYLVPGWRVGWIITYNKLGALTKEVGFVCSLFEIFELNTYCYVPALLLHTL